MGDRTIKVKSKQPKNMHPNQTDVNMRNHQPSKLSKFASEKDKKRRFSCYLHEKCICCICLFCVRVQESDFKESNESRISERIHKQEIKNKLNEVKKPETIKRHKVVKIKGIQNKDKEILSTKSLQ